MRGNLILQNDEIDKHVDLINDSNEWGEESRTELKRQEKVLKKEKTKTKTKLQSTIK